MLERTVVVPGLQQAGALERADLTPRLKGAMAGIDGTTGVVGRAVGDFGIDRAGVRVDHGERRARQIVLAIEAGAQAQG